MYKVLECILQQEIYLPYKSLLFKILIQFVLYFVKLLFLARSYPRSQVFKIYYCTAVVMKFFIPVQAVQELWSGKGVVFLWEPKYRVSQEECARLREGVPYVKVYRYNPKHLCPKLNGYGDNGQRKLWSSGGSTHCTCQLTFLSMSVLECGVILRQFSARQL